MVRSFVEIDVLVPLADREDAFTTCKAVYPYVEGKDCRIHVIHVVPNDPDAVDTAAVEQRADDIFTVARDCFESAEIPVSTETYYGRNVSAVILEAAEAYAVESIILTPRERSLWRKLLSQNVLGSLMTALDTPLIVIPASDTVGQ